MTTKQIAVNGNDNMTTKTIKVSKQNGRYYPVTDGTVDMRGKGFRTLREVRDRFLFITGERVKVQAV